MSLSPFPLEFRGSSLEASLADHPVNMQHRSSRPRSTRIRSRRFRSYSTAKPSSKSPKRTKRGNRPRWSRSGSGNRTHMVRSADGPTLSPISRLPARRRRLRHEGKLPTRSNTIPLRSAICRPWNSGANFRAKFCGCGSQSHPRRRHGARQDHRCHLARLHDPGRGSQMGERSAVKRPTRFPA